MIDISAWVKFKLSDIGFTNYHGIRQTKADREEGDIPLLTAGKENQGVASYISNAPAVYADAITVDMFGNSFFHKGNYAGDDNIYFFVNDKISDNAKLFIAAILNANNSKIYAYKEQFRQPQADALSVPLPATSDGQPDWGYMESYMKAVMEESEKAISNLKKVDDTKHLIDVSGWKDMCIGDYFEVEYGTFRPKDKLGIGDYNYITTSGFNNGITDKIDVADHQGGCITVASDGALMGSAFYQEEPFSTSNIVSTLTPFETTPLNKYNAQFICALIFSKRSEFGWLGFKFSVDRVRNLIIKVPIASAGEPDWQYMEDYMKSIMNKQEMAADNLSKIV